MPSAADIDRFLASPSAYFDYSSTKMMGVPRALFDALQLAGLKSRFARYRGALPMLDKLADSQGINAINDIDDVLPLLFDHAVYKSYPASLLEKHRYPQLTAWLNKLTTIDLSAVDVSACRSIDDWMMMLNRDTPMAICHTSGTTGTLSFLPWSKSEWKRLVSEWTVVFFQRFGVDSPAEKMPLNLDCVYPFFRSGNMSHTIINDAIVDIIAGSEDRFHACYPGRLSSDMLLLAAKHRAAIAKGEVEKLEISPELLARRTEFETQQRNMPQRATEFFSNMRTHLTGKRVFMMATSNMLYTLADSGLKQGLKNVFAPDTVILTGGGGKGIVLPDDWQETVKQFIGVDRLFNNYGMSEMSGQMSGCEHGHYHCAPWIIPYILDPDTAKPLSRHGTVTGRFAFYDLMPETRWGGFVTGDEVTMEWDKPCHCGQTTPYLQGKIQRISDKKTEDGDEKLSCAAAPAAYAEALDFLNEGTLV